MDMFTCVARPLNLSKKATGYVANFIRLGLARANVTSKKKKKVQVEECQQRYASRHTIATCSSECDIAIRDGRHR